MLMSTTSVVEQQPTQSAAIASAPGSRLSSEHIQPTTLEWNVGVGSRKMRSLNYPAFSAEQPMARRCYGRGRQQCNFQVRKELLGCQARPAARGGTPADGGSAADAVGDDPDRYGERGHEVESYGVG